MKLTIDMPVVSGCSASECTYNVEGGCHARAITVGDATHPGCDTFMDGAPHARDTSRTAGVGACKVSGCRHNDDYECTADAIDVGSSGGSICCLTYAAR